MRSALIILLILACSVFPFSFDTLVSKNIGRSDLHLSGMTDDLVLLGKEDYTYLYDYDLNLVDSIDISLLPSTAYGIRNQIIKQDTLIYFTNIGSGADCYGGIKRFKINNRSLTFIDSSESIFTDRCVFQTHSYSNDYYFMGSYPTYIYDIQGDTIFENTISNLSFIRYHKGKYYGYISNNLIEEIRIHAPGNMDIMDQIPIDKSPDMMFFIDDTFFVCDEQDSITRYRFQDDQIIRLGPSEEWPDAYMSPVGRQYHFGSGILMQEVFDYGFHQYFFDLYSKEEYYFKVDIGNRYGSYNGMYFVDGGDGDISVYRFNRNVGIERRISEKQKKDDIICTPNPANYKIDILSISGKIRAINIYSVAGKKMHSTRNYHKKSYTWIPGNIPSGLYIVTATGDGETKSVKVLYY